MTDNLTGLIWLKNANCFGNKTWANALSDCNGLSSGFCGLTDDSVAGDWRFPNVKEYLSMIYLVGLSNMPTPGLPSDHPFTDVQGDYWSSSTDNLNSSDAWLVSMGLAFVKIKTKTSSDLYVWPVR